MQKFRCFSNSITLLNKIKRERGKRKRLGSVPGFRFGESDDHTLEAMVKEDLATEPGVFVKDPGSGIPNEDVFLVVRPRGKLIEPFLGNVDLAVSGTGVDLFESVGFWVDQARVD